MSQADHDLIRSGVERRLAAVESLIPSTPAWRSVGDADLRPATVRVVAGPAVRQGPRGGRRLGLLVAVGAVARPAARLRAARWRKSTGPRSEPDSAGLGRADRRGWSATTSDRTAADHPGASRVRLDRGRGRRGLPPARLLPRRRRIHRIQRRPDGRRAAWRLRPGPREQRAAAPGRPHRLDPGPSRPRIGRTLRTDGRGPAGDGDRRHRDLPIRRAQGPDRPVHRYRPGADGTSSLRTRSGSSWSSCRIDRCSSSSAAGPNSSTPASASSRTCSARSGSRTAARRPDRRPKRSKHHRQPISKEGLQCPGLPCFPLPCSCC